MKRTSYLVMRGSRRNGKLQSEVKVGGCARAEVAANPQRVRVIQ